ncbi:hypothetical protein BDV06DRAFT_231647 [Aspergillus oleicola]
MSPPAAHPSILLDAAPAATNLELYDDWVSANTSLEQPETSWHQEYLLGCNCSQSWTFNCQCWSPWSDANFSQSQGTDVGSVHSSQSAISPDGLDPTASSERNDPSVDKSSTKAKGCRRLSKDAVTVLRTWLNRHRHYPYPTQEEREQLHRETGLSNAQISNWFSNTRRRKLAKRASVAQTNAVDISQQTPLERWKNSPPQCEAAAATDIVRALEAMPSWKDDMSSSVPSQQECSSHSSSASFIVGAPSLSTFTHSQSSGSEISPADFQRRIQRPPTPMPSGRPRRRRRKLPRFRNAQGNRKSDKPQQYQCTFCTDSFRTKYDWARHEKSLHLPVDRWPCAPRGGLVCDDDGVTICVFCQCQGADDDHLNQHDYLACREKPSEQRTFDRKDHLRQHLKLIHGVYYHFTMDEWHESRASMVSSRCGFCDATFSSWTDRVDHVAGHFKDGTDMVHWKGDWGFDAEIQRMVKNAMPPYLLSHERHTMDPWKSSALWGATDSEEVVDSFIKADEDVPNAFNRYTSLHEQLVAYIRGEMAHGICPSDKMLQQRARQISYGHDDPWDQTYADYDPLWLASVKHAAGLGPLGGLDGHDES